MVVIKMFLVIIKFKLIRFVNFHRATLCGSRRQPVSVHLSVCYMAKELNFHLGQIYPSL